MLKLNPRPDGYGYIYGTYETDDGSAFRVNIMPPETEWDGDTKLDRGGPHPTEWVIYVDGEEIARATRREDLAVVLGRSLINK